MSVSIDPSLYLDNNNTKKTQTKTLGKDDFLKILITQLQNQDPTNPMKDKEFISQMANFSSLEQMSNMNQTLQNFIDYQKQNSIVSMSQAIGSKVNWEKVVATSDSNIEVQQGSGIIEMIQLKDGDIQFTLTDGTEIAPSDIKQMNTSLKETNQMLLASQLIGKTVTWVDDDEQLENMVSSVSLKNGKIYYELEDGTTIDRTQIIRISQ